MGGLLLHEKQLRFCNKPEKTISFLYLLSQVGGELARWARPSGDTWRRFPAVRQPGSESPLRLFA